MAHYPLGSSHSINQAVRTHLCFFLHHTQQYSSKPAYKSNPYVKMEKTSPFYLVPCQEWPRILQLCMLFSSIYLIYCISHGNPFQMDKIHLPRHWVRRVKHLFNTVKLCSVFLKPGYWWFWSYCKPLPLQPYKKATTSPRQSTCKAFYYLLMRLIGFQKLLFEVPLWRSGAIQRIILHFISTLQ